jgi:hypothetical protein
VDSGKLHISHIKKIALCDLQDGSKNKAISLATLQATLKANKGD